MSKVRILRFLSLFFIYFILTKCNSTKLIKTQNKINIDSSLVYLLNGRYFNKSSDTSFFKTNFWQHLHKNKSNDSIYNNEGKYFELNIFDKTTLHVRLLNSNKNTLSLIKYNYIIKNGIILIKKNQNKLIEGVPFFIYRKTYETLNLSTNKNKDLVLGCNGAIVGGILVIQFGISIEGNYTFERQ